MKLRIMVCAFIFAFGVAAAGEGMGQPAPFVAVGRVTEADSVETKRYTGQVASSSQVNLVARVSGELLDLGFQEGDMVEAGQVLCELDPVRYEALVKSAEAKVAQAEARLSYAEISFNRANDLYHQKAGTKDTMDGARSEYDACRAALLAAQAELITARDDLKNTRIVAPIRGKIGVTKFTRGNYLTPSSGTIATIVQVDPLRVSFSMSNRDFLSMFGTEAELKANADIRLRLADDRLYPRGGNVEFIDNHANARTDTVQIYVKFDNPDGILRAGSTVQVMLTRRDGSKMPSIAPSAVMHDSKAAYVYVVTDDNRVERRDVELGPGTAGTQLIRSGVKPGELVVVDGTHKTRPGGTIQPDHQG